MINMLITNDVKRRFYAQVNMDMQWIGHKVPDGYGRIRVNGKQEYAHRVSYVIHIGNIPTGMLVLHSCDDPSCVLPEHLHLGTDADNAKERAERGRNGDRRGGKNGRAKVAVQQVLEIREMYKAGWTQCDLALRFGIHQPQISSIVTKISWKHL